MSAPRNNRHVPSLAKIDAAIASNIRTMDPPKKIRTTFESPWTAGAERGWHRFTCVMVLDRETQSGPQYRLDHVIEETGRPPNFAQSAPTTCGYAWFAIVEYLASGKVVAL